MDVAELTEQIKGLLTISKPFIQKLVDEKVIPAVKTFAYKTLQKKADRIINNLVTLKSKAENELNEDKRKAHLLGLKLGAEAIVAIGEKLVEAGTILLEE